ncbi:MAG TPA: ABC transporter permease [Chloroflexota bacterium]|nr:ABC transporter permease [Chloroflexota bacterium]
MAETVSETLASEAMFSRRSAKPRSLWVDAVRTFRQNRVGMAGFVIAVLVILIAIFAPLIAPYGYTAQDWQHIGQPPSLQHIMGTDALGRDLFSRVLMGIRTAVMVAVLVTFSTAAIGTLVGASAALAGGWLDAMVVWLMDTLLAFPSLWLAAFISVVARPTTARLAASIYKSTGWAAMQDPVVFDYLVVFGSLSLVWWAGLGRLVRGQVLSLREKEFIEAQKAIGASGWWITTRHLVPNVLGEVIVQMSNGFGGAMLAESSLSFLGIGIRPPGASLGAMIFDGMATWRSQPYLVAMPGLTLALIVAAFVFMGDGLNDALNPRIRER